MKKIAVILLVLFYTMMVACACSTTDSSHIEPPTRGDGSQTAPPGIHLLANVPFEQDYRGMRIIIEDARSYGIHIRFENDFNKRVMYGYGFDLYVFADDEWRLLDYKVVFPAILVYEQPYYLHDQYLNFIKYFGTLECGRYRFVQDLVLLPDQTMDYFGAEGYSDYSFYLYADFTIV